MHSNTVAKKKKGKDDEPTNWQHFDGMTKNLGKEYAKAKIEGSKLP